MIVDSLGVGCDAHLSIVRDEGVVRLQVQCGDDQVADVLVTDEIREFFHSL